MTPADEDESIMSEQLANKGYSLPLNKIIKGNCIKLMKTFPNNSIDVIFADPPYNLQLKNNLSRPDSTKVNGVTEDWEGSIVSKSMISLPTIGCQKHKEF